MSRRWRYLRARRGDFFDYPRPDLIPPPSFIGRSLRRGFTPRRGDYLWTPPAAVVQAGPGEWIQPPFRQPGRRGMLCRRGDFFQFPLVGLAPVAPTGVPQFITARRPRVSPPRRGHYNTPIPPRYDLPPQWRRPRCPQPQLRRRDRFLEPPWPAIIPAPSVWRPDLIRVRRRPIPRPRGMHCRYFEPGWPQAEPGGGTLTASARAVSTIGANSRTVTTLGAAERTTSGVGSADRNVSTLTDADRDTPTFTGG